MFKQSKNFQYIIGIDQMMRQVIIIPCTVLEVLYDFVAKFVKRIFVFQPQSLYCTFGKITPNSLFIGWPMLQN